MNRGILASTGSWIWFVNAGDEVSPALDLGALAERLEKTDGSWAVGAVTLMDGVERSVTLPRVPERYFVGPRASVIKVFSFIGGR